MKTFTQARPLVEDRGYVQRRERYLSDLGPLLSSGEIDAPIVSLIERISEITHCFTLQSCYGHFVLEGRPSEYGIKRTLPDLNRSSTVHYRIAYMAFCVQNNNHGRHLLEDLRAVADVDPEYTQFGSADWFWNRSVNVYVLQVQPKRFMSEDSFDVEVAEAVEIEASRDAFYSRLDETMDRHLRLSV